MYLIPDLTGQSELCKVENDVRLIIAADQKLEFHTPVFADTLNIIQIGTTNVTFIRGVDWNYGPSDYDVTAMSEMQMKDDTFDKILLKSIVILNPFVSLKYKVSLSYQKLYPVPSKVARDPAGETLNVTGELILDMLESIRRHELLLAPVKDVHGIAPNNPLMLEIDTTMGRAENFIVKERHQVNVPANLEHIHPIAGSFYKEKFVAYNGTTGQTLTEGEDYVFWGANLPKTAMAQTPSPVYDFILLKKPFVGPIDITYHAFGGDPTIHDVRTLSESINNIMNYLVENQLLTPQTIGNVQPLILIRNKISELEEKMRRLASEGRPSYGDVSHGRCLKKRIAADDTNLHWWTIAELYKVEGSEEIFVSDTAKLRISTLLTKFAFDVIVNVNTTNELNKLNVNCISATYPKGYIPFVDYSEMENIIRPQFRIIWNENTVQGSGIYLQIGLRLKTVREETIAVEDWSGGESCWKLIPDPVEAVLPEDNTITLPSKNHIWDTINPDSRQVSYLVPFQDGHLIWAGSEALNRPESGWKNFTLVHTLEDDTDIRNIRQIRIDLEEVGSTVFPITLDVIPGSEKLTGTAAFTYNGKPAYINAVLNRNPVTKKIELSVNADISAGPTSTRLNMRHVLIFL